MDTIISKDALLRAGSVTAALREASDRIEQARELPADIVAALHEARLFRLLLPTALTGDELDPISLSQVTETVAAADASTAWCLGQAAGCAMSAAYLEPEIADAVFGPPDAVLAWGAGIQGKAIAVDGGYRVSGRWTFASGSRHATWLGGHSFVFESDGTTPRIGADGRQLNRTALFRRDQADIEDNWHVIGLCGTGSDSYSVTDLFVPEAYTLDRDTPSERRFDGDVFQLSTTQVYASAFSGVMLGIARGTLDDLTAIALTKTPRGAASSLRDSEAFHLQLAELEARYRAARAFLHTTQLELWDAVQSRTEFTIEHRAGIRLATTHAINQGHDIVTEAYRLAGQHAIFESGTLERRLRDASAASQQVQGRKTHYATVGRILLGLDPDATMFL